MISNVFKTCCLFCSTVFLAACVGTDDNGISPGLVVHVGESHYEDKPTASRPAVADRLLANYAPEVTGGYAHDGLEHIEISDRNGKSLSVYRAYIVLDNIELVPCFALAQIPGLLLDNLVGKAFAHEGGGVESAGGRALNAPNVIDLVTQDGYRLELGDMPVAPGKYCGIRVALVRLATYAYGKPSYDPGSTDDPVTEPETPDMSGMMYALRADYCDAVDGLDACTHRSPVDLDDNGASYNTVHELPFTEPLEISIRHPVAHVVLGIHYGSWLKDIDITTLSSDEDAQAQLLQNILDSLFVDVSGWGDLPENL